MPAPPEGSEPAMVRAVGVIGVLSAITFVSQLFIKNHCYYANRGPHLSTDYANPEVIEEILNNTQTIAMVGVSDKQERPSFGVAEYLRDFYEIIPVNPNLKELFGVKSYSTISDVPQDLRIDLINVFRKSEELPLIVQEAISRGVPYIWSQLGIVNEEAFELARRAGIKMVMDRCLLIEHRKGE